MSFLVATPARGSYDMGRIVKSADTNQCACALVQSASCSEMGISMTPVGDTDERGHAWTSTSYLGLSFSYDQHIIKF